MPQKSQSLTGAYLLLYQSLARVFRSFDLKTVSEESLKAICRIMRIDYGSLLILTERGTYLEHKFIYGFGAKESMDPKFGFSSSDLVRISHDLIATLHEYPSEGNGSSSIEGHSLGRLAIFPSQLVYDRTSVFFFGVLQNHLSSTLLSEEGFHNLEVILTDYAFALSNAFTIARMNELVTKDDLTLAFNRRFFEDYMTEEIERARRFHKPLSLIFLDLDGLRDVNSRFGHAMGSKTLQEAASRVMNSVRTIDKVVRYGGDEFCVILPETDAEGSLEVAERIRQKLASSLFLVDDTGGIEITGSFGVACYPIHALTKEDLVKKADEAMYSIKSHTKNDISVAKPLRIVQN